MNHTENTDYFKPLHPTVTLLQTSSSIKTHNQIVQRNYKKNIECVILNDIIVKGHYYYTCNQCNKNIDYHIKH